MNKEIIQIIIQMIITKAKTELQIIIIIIYNLSMIIHNMIYGDQRTGIFSFFKLCVNQFTIVKKRNRKVTHKK